MIKIKWVKISADAIIPSFAHKGDAGADICSCEDCEIAPGKRKLIKTGLKVEVPKGYELQIRPRSGVSLNTSLLIPNSPGTIDSGYRGEVGIILWNAGDTPHKVKKGDRIAQVVVQKIPDVIHIEAIELSMTERGESGFGSTGE